MWYKSPEWQACVEAFDAWFYEVVEYVNEDGERKIQSLHARTMAAIDAVVDVAHLDPAPIWDICRWINNRTQNELRANRGYPADHIESVSVAEIADRVQQVQWYLERILRVGLTAEKPDGVAIEAVSTNEPRDAWMYGEKLAGRTHGEILAALARDHGDWDLIETEQAVGRAIDRYCDRHSLAKIRRRTNETQ